jgi:flagellar protein FlaJ
MIKKQIREMQSVIAELQNSQANIKQVLSEIKLIEGKYLKKEITFPEYSQYIRKILAGRTKEEAIYAYNNYERALKNKLIKLNSEIFKIIYEDKSDESISFSPTKKKSAISLPSMSELEIGDVVISNAVEEKREEKRQETIEKIEKIYIEVPHPKKIPSTPAPIALSPLKRLAYAVTAEKKPWTDKENLFLGGFLSKEFFDYVFHGKESGIFGTTKILPSIFSYNEKEGDLKIERSDVLDPYLLEKQIKEIKNLISKKKPEVYKASTLGYMANITVRKISIYFIERYPEYFKKVYRSVRFANMKILANTYINIVFFVTLVSLLVSFPVAMVFFAMQGNLLLMALFKTIVTSLTITLSVFGIGMYLPNMTASTRRRSINTNLPFAIDHMSSVISAGVNPATMFKLISTSREYGEVSIELEKVVSYIEFFGYDIITALKAIALTTPSEAFKEFVDGFVSTIETGGDLKEFLSQKSSEALLNYRLERQKYVESLGTYSDIYTGVLIAAPLFFVTALSLVSVIGGDIGGMSVSSILNIGTYIAIPMLNMLFLVFLELNQPEI